MPVDGLGVQGHLGLQFGLPSTVAGRTCGGSRARPGDRVHRGRRADAAAPDDVKTQAQAQGYSALLRACLLATRCVSFTVWGFTDKYTGCPASSTGEGTATLLNEDFARKPAYDAIRDTLLLAGR